MPSLRTLLIAVIFALALGGCAARGPVSVSDPPLPAEPDPGPPPAAAPAPAAPAPAVPAPPPAAKELVLNHRPLPAISPGGEFLLGATVGELILFSLPEREERFRFDTGAATPDALRWSPRGDAFVLAVERPPAVFCGDTGGELSRLAEGRRPLLTWSGDGDYLLLANPLTVVHTATGETWPSPLEEPAEVRSPLFSPDGQEIHFTFFDVEAGEDLWVWNWREGEVRRLTAGNQGCYPWGWWTDRYLLVELGAISTGGGHVNGFGRFDVLTGAVTALEQDPSYGWRLLAPVPGGDLVVCQMVHAFGEDRRVVLYDLAAGTGHCIAEDMVAVGAAGGPPGTVVLLLRPDDGSWRLSLYRVAGGTLEDLVLAGEPLHLLGTAHGAVYYLEAAAVGWRLRWAELP